MTKRRVAIVGGGLAGVTAAWQLAQQARAEGDVEAVLYEASSRLGGTVETVLREDFTIDCGPDGWVTEKPWARELVRELGLHGKLIASNDEDRVTYIVRDGKLIPMPDGMRMMVPTDLAALEGSSLFSEGAKRAYAGEPARAAELRASAPQADESIASFVERHFGREVLTRIGAPLLSGVFGGDVRQLSVRAVMPGFVQMEREHGSLILALKAAAKSREGEEKHTIFTSLEGGTGALIDRMKAEIPAGWLRLNSAVTGLAQDASGWTVEAAELRESGERDEPDESGERGERFDAVILAVPAHVARELMRPISARMSELVSMDASSAVIVALAFTQNFHLPKGFGFLVPAGEQSMLLAGTFVDQKYPSRVPQGGRLLRAFFGGVQAQALMQKTDPELAVLGRDELQALLGPLPEPAFTIVRRWPRSLPQYGVGHLDRMAELERLRATHPNLWLLGNAYRGVGLPDLIRDARAAAKEFLGG